MIQARHIRKRYRGQAVLEDVCLAVSPGRSLILGGDNGSGKTTLLHILVGLRAPDAGRVFWNDRELKSRRAWRRARETWGFLPQHPVLPPLATVEALLRFHARLRKTPLGRAYDWLEQVGLSDARRKRIESLSGGMRQRLGIALVMFFGPELIVMDEPTSSLDPRWRGQLAQWTQEQANRGAAVLVTSQLHESWGDSADHLYCERGRIVAASMAVLP